MPGTDPSFLMYILIFCGAGLGGLLRYLVSGMVHSWWGPTFPLGTMIVNVSGCLVMGYLATSWMGPVLVRDEVRSAVLIGILGGYTTYSTFGHETLMLARDGDWLRAGGYVLGSVVLSLLAVWGGAALATKVYGTGAP